MPTNPPSRIRDAIRSRLATEGSVSAGEIAADVGVSRQAAHHHLAKLYSTGEVERIGAGRSTRYVRTSTFQRRWSLPGLMEEHVWRDTREAVPCLRDLAPESKNILHYAMTEMVNNAIDHSSGTFVEVTVWCKPDVIAFEVADDGVGAFANVREKLHLADEFAAIQELTKGKQTTAPEQHTGEGIFFTSKAVDLFELESSGLRWIVDTIRGDQAVADSTRHIGTRVRCELDPATSRRIADLFNEFADPDTGAFDRTEVTVRLFEMSDTFVSRSEAKRLASQLERFDQVVIDFSGIETVGQGFVDELFRVWAREHPGTVLVPMNMNPSVERMVRRGLAAPA
jgi:DNA-binding transcriptional ArsR family regulator